MGNRGWVVGRCLVMLALVAAANGCGSEPATEAVNEDDMARQIQTELNAAAQADPASFARAQTVRPALKCVENLGNRHYRAHFGFSSGATSAIAIPIGFFNRFWPPPVNRGQPTTFAPGEQADIIQVPFESFSAAIWVLGNHFAIATRFSKACPVTGAGGSSGAGGVTGAGGSGVGGSAGVGGSTGAGGAFTCDHCLFGDQDPCNIHGCDVVAQACIRFAVLDGTACNDGNLCTTVDTCQAGVCVGSAPKTCTAIDACHAAGVCNPTTGGCSNPAQPDGTTCGTTANRCGVPEQCTAGACAPAQATECGQACDQCTFGAADGQTDICSPTTDGCSNCDRQTSDCSGFSDPADRALCEDLYACLVAPAHPGTSIPGSCITAGDPIPCWCGTNQLKCATDNTPPTQANGPCLQQIMAAGKTTTAAVINQRFVDPNFPLGRAINLAICQGLFCSGECEIPDTEPCPPSPDTCHVAARDLATGLCTSTAKPDGASCEDGQACTQGDTCRAGVCISGPTCPPLLNDQCHASSGTCQGQECVYAPFPDGTLCNPMLSDFCGVAVTGTCHTGFCLAQGPDVNCSCKECTFGVPSGGPDLCSTVPEGCFNCDPTVMGCDGIADPNDRASCQALYTCLVTPTHPGSVIPGSCMNPKGDFLPCWCGTNLNAGCSTSNAPPTQANGPCLQQIFTAAKSTDAATINQRLVDPSYPVGLAVGLALCQGTFCPQACGLP